MFSPTSSTKIDAKIKAKNRCVLDFLFWCIFRIWAGKTRPSSHQNGTQNRLEDASRELGSESGESVTLNNATTFWLDSWCHRGSDIEEKLKKIEPRSHQSSKTLLESILHGFREDFGGQVGGTIASKMKEKLTKQEIIDLLPHREPMLLIDELIDIKHLHSATAIMNVKKNSFYVDGHFPDNPVLPGVLIVEAFGQAAAALTAHGIDKKEYENKLVFLMSVEKAKFRNPVIPDCRLELKIEAIRSHGRVWKYKGEAFVEGKKMSDAQWSATIVDRK